MPYYWLKDENTSNTYTLDTSVIEIDIPAMSRSFTSMPTFSDGSILTGTGSMLPGLITLVKRFNKGTNPTAWNTLMYAFKTWIGQPKANKLWFYISDGSITLRAQVYPVTKSAETMTTFATTGPVSFGLQMITGYFQNVVTATTTATITGPMAQTMNITNNGELRTPPVIVITNTAAFYLFQVQTSTNYGFRLEGTFAAGSTLSFDCSTGNFTLNGAVVQGYQTGGSIFLLNPGVNALTVYATATAAGGFSVSWNERYF